MHLRTIPSRAWNWLRDRYSSSVLGTTSPSLPGLGGGLTRPVRLVITLVSLALAVGAGLLVAVPAGAFFFMPALMVAGIFGDAELAIPALALSVLLAARMFPGLDLWLFGGAACVQTLVALGLRQLFRESRRWGVRYRQLLNMMASAITISDSAGRIERPHPELSRLIGLEWPNYRGVRWLNAVHPDDQKRLPPPGPFKDVTLQRSEIRLKDPRTGEWRWHLMRAVPLRGEDGEVEEWISILTDIHERKLRLEQRDVVAGEARHRLKNLMTIIESMVKSSAPRGDAAVEAFQNKFLGRLHALSTASDLALAGNYSTLEAGEVAAATLAPFLEGATARITFGGPRLPLAEATGGMLALALNELATNAIKYGALSVPDGRVSLSWTAAPSDDGVRVVFTWQESGGPAPQAPRKEGYGSRVIRFVPSRERDGTVEMTYPPEGYVCRIAFTMAKRVATLEAD